MLRSFDPEKNGDVIGQLEKLFNKYSLTLQILETWITVKEPIRCYNDYFGVYPVDWNIEDVTELDEIIEKNDLLFSIDWCMENK